MPKHPVQPVVWDGHGVIRFKGNAIVQHLLGVAQAHGCDLNTLAIMRFSDDDRTQFAQLIGYSVSGAGDLSYFDRDKMRTAERRVQRLLGKDEGKKKFKKR